jgi:hypothetical protein
MISKLKKVFLTAMLALAFPVFTLAAPHSVTLGITRSPNDTQAPGQGYTAWRKSGLCPASVTTTAGFTQLNSVLFTTTTYTDTTVVPGLYCYVVTFTNPTATSGPSNTAAATVLPNSPTSVTVGGTT